MERAILRAGAFGQHLVWSVQASQSCLRAKRMNSAVCERSSTPPEEFRRTALVRLGRESKSSTRVAQEASIQRFVTFVEGGHAAGLHNRGRHKKSPSRG